MSPDPPTASGYYWLGDGEDRLLVDGGAIGPPHLPAHSHNDHFAVLWWVDGQRILTDSGVFEYLPTSEREYARSVEAHNTVQCADVEPIPTGGSYLFGRRIDPTVRYGDARGVSWFDGQYRRRASDGVQYRHRRQIYGTDDWWLVWDRVSAEEAAPVKSRLHFDPAVDLRTASDGDRRRLDIRIRRRSAGSAADLAHIYPIDAARVTREERPYFPEFGRSVPRPAVTLRQDGADVSFGFLLSKQHLDTADVAREGDEVTGLWTDDAYWSLPETEE